MRCYITRSGNNGNKSEIHTVTLETHKAAAATYFGKESFEELPVLEVGVVKTTGGEGVRWVVGAEEGMTMSPRSSRDP